MTNTDLVPACYFDPPSPFYYGGRLFDLTDRIANRDDVLLPFSRLRDDLLAHGHRVDTADALLVRATTERVDYYSFGISKNYKRFVDDPRVRLRAFVIFEPPVVSPHVYAQLPELTRHFERVYVHNTHGDGYSLDGVDRTKLRKGFFAQPYRGVLDAYWENRERSRKLVVINANKRPQSELNELYSKRIEAIAALARFQAVDLYGPGWERIALRVGRLKWALYWPALRNRKALLSVNHGPCGSKYETLSRYAFCLCFENMIMDGYITEKLFDCLYAGTIPVYLGAPDIERYVDPACYIDFRRFESYEALWEHLQSLDETALEGYREAGKRFLASERFLPFYDALPRMVAEAP